MLSLHLYTFDCTYQIRTICLNSKIRVFIQEFHSPVSEGPLLGGDHKYKHNQEILGFPKAKSTRAAALGGVKALARLSLAGLNGRAPARGRQVAMKGKQTEGAAATWYENRAVSGHITEYRVNNALIHGKNDEDPLQGTKRGI